MQDQEEYFLALFFFYINNSTTDSAGKTWCNLLKVSICEKLHKNYSSDKNNNGSLPYTEETASQARTRSIIVDIYNNNAE